MRNGFSGFNINGDINVQMGFDLWKSFKEYILNVSVDIKFLKKSSVVKFIKFFFSATFLNFPINRETFLMSSIIKGTRTSIESKNLRSNFFYFYETIKFILWNFYV